eukprot:scaffold4399_cov175-Ochromonas_danica.AAC.22
MSALSSIKFNNDKSIPEWQGGENDRDQAKTPIIGLINPLLRFVAAPSWDSSASSRKPRAQSAPTSRASRLLTHFSFLHLQYFETV